MNISKGTGPKILAIAIYVAALAAAPTLLNDTLAQTESANTTTSTTTAAKGGPASSILISSSGKNYQCTSTGTATNPPTLGIHLSASKEGGILKG